MSALFLPPLPGFRLPSSSSAGSFLRPSRLVCGSSAFGLSILLKAPRDHLCLLVYSSFQESSHLHYLLRLAGNLKKNLLGNIKSVDSKVEACISTKTSWLCLFSGIDFSKAKSNKTTNTETSSSDSSGGRLWTNVLLAVNILVYVAQVATNGKLLLWGAKVNNLIDKGQIWRLATSSFLHAGVIHLMVNCYSLNSIGPTVEKICGHKRFLAVYLGSAISSSAMSYFFCQLPAVGASGAIFGLVASSALFVMRHRRFIGRGNQELLETFKVIAINMAIGFSVKGIDNWGHLGGLLGGAAISWFVGPLLRPTIRPEDGKLVLADKAPIFQLTKTNSSLL